MDSTMTDEQTAGDDDRLADAVSERISELEDRLRDSLDLIASLERGLVAAQRQLEAFERLPSRYGGGEADADLRRRVAERVSLVKRIHGFSVKRSDAVPVMKMVTETLRSAAPTPLFARDAAVQTGLDVRQVTTALHYLERRGVATRVDTGLYTIAEDA